MLHAQMYFPVIIIPITTQSSVHVSLSMSSLHLQLIQQHIRINTLCTSNCGKLLLLLLLFVVANVQLLMPCYRDGDGCAGADFIVVAAVVVVILLLVLLLLLLLVLLL